MEIRKLVKSDREQFRLLIKSVYKESELAMWFEREPTDDELDLLFDYKIDAISQGSALDLVATDSAGLMGECEVAITNQIGKVGVMVKKGHRREGIGEGLLVETIKDVRKLGVTALISEVIDENVAAKHFFVKNKFECKGIGDRVAVRNGAAHRVLIFEKDISGV